MSGKLCRYFPTHPYVGAVICYGFVQDGMIIVKQCEKVESCLQKVYKDNPEILKRRLKKIQKIKEKIQEIERKKDA